MAAVAVSFFVVIIAVAVSAGFRHEIRGGISKMAGDILLTSPDFNYLDEKSPLSVNQSYIPKLDSLEGVEKVSPVICRAGIVRHNEDIYGVMVKGVEGGVRQATGAHVDDTVALAVAVPASMAEQAGIRKGDRLLTYFIAEKIKVRQFNVVDIYEPLVRVDDRFLIYADISDMRRLNGWTDEQASMFEVILSQEYTDRDGLELKSAQIEDLIYENASDDDDLLRTFSSAKRYPQIFDWFGVIDFNAVFVLLLMIAVAGVNMMTGLLIMLFENISAIGLLKSIGMRNRAIARVFLMCAMGVVLKGMIIGNLLAFAFCIVQDTSHFITLDPVNYFVSYVPVHIDVTTVLLADAVAFASIMVLMLIPSMFVLRVDPAKTVKMD
jgi:lipoprotein-releasing system permease protein